MGKCNNCRLRDCSKLAANKCSRIQRFSVSKLENLSDNSSYDGCRNSFLAYTTCTCLPSLAFRSVVTLAERVCDKVTRINATSAFLQLLAAKATVAAFPAIASRARRQGTAVYNGAQPILFADYAIAAIAAWPAFRAIAIREPVVLGCARISSNASCSNVTGPL